MNQTVPADIFFIPLKLHNTVKTIEKTFDPNTVVAIVNVHVYSINRGEKYNFDTVFEKYLERLAVIYIII